MNSFFLTSLFLCVTLSLSVRSSDKSVLVSSVTAGFRTHSHFTAKTGTRDTPVSMETPPPSHSRSHTALWLRRNWRANVKRTKNEQTQSRRRDRDRDPSLGVPLLQPLPPSLHLSTGHTHLQTHHSMPRHLTFHLLWFWFSNTGALGKTQRFGSALSR